MQYEEKFEEKKSIKSAEPDPAAVMGDGYGYREGYSDNQHGWRGNDGAQQSNYQPPRGQGYGYRGGYRPRGPTGPPPVCFNCQRLGHYAARCRMSSLSSESFNWMGKRKQFNYQLEKLYTWAEIENLVEKLVKEGVKRELIDQNSIAERARHEKERDMNHARVMERLSKHEEPAKPTMGRVQSAMPPTADRISEPVKPAVDRVQSVKSVEPVPNDNLSAPQSASSK